MAPKVDIQQMRRISKYAMDQLDKDMIHDSPVFANVDERLATYPKFSLTELGRGSVLGKGQFGVVSEIAKVNLSNDNSSGNRSADEAVKTYFERMESNPEINKSEQQNRSFIAEHCVRDGKDARYAVKFLHDDVVGDPGTFYKAAKDLALETYFLSTVEHTNIIKMRAMAMGSMCSQNYFIVMDRLYDTLEKRLVHWKKTEEKTKGVKGKVFDKKGKKRGQLLDDRLTVAFDLSAALEYLHSCHIIHRDIKPDNIGFDVRGDVKIFDFGLARELREQDRTERGLFKLTGKTGSMVYMAPEVWKEEPYNDRADVYSFAILLWEILSLERPFKGYTARMLSSQIFDKGGRPKIDGFGVSTRLQILLKRAWAQNIPERMSSRSVTEILKKELIILRDDKNESSMDYTHMRRKSTFVAPRRRIESVRTLLTAKG